MDCRVVWCGVVGQDGLWWGKRSCGEVGQGENWQVICCRLMCFDVKDVGVG